MAIGARTRNRHKNAGRFAMAVYKGFEYQLKRHSSNKYIELLRFAETILATQEISWF